MLIMKTCLVLSLMGILLINGATSKTYTHMIFVTATQVPNLPDFVVVGVVNDLPVYHYDSNIKRLVPKQFWVKKMTEEEPQFTEKNARLFTGYEELIKANNEIGKQFLNLTEGLHTWQIMASCEWDDETDEITGSYKTALDREDLFSLDWENETWVAARPEAFRIKEFLKRRESPFVTKRLLSNECVEALKNFVRFGKSTMKRTELPLVSLLQKSSSAPVTCHATGFYPDRAMIFWTKDGEELYENVDLGEILPNHDGTFQMSVDLDVSSVPSEDWDRYECVFQLSGVKEDLLTRLEHHNIRTNGNELTEKTHMSTIVAAVLAVLGVFVLAAVGVFLYRTFHNKNVI